MKKVFKIEMQWDLDTITIEKYNEVVMNIIKEIKNPSVLLLDFSKVSYINSTAIWNISDWYNKLDDIDSEIIILWISESILDTISLVWLADRLTFFDSFDDFKLKYNNS